MEELVGDTLALEMVVVSGGAGFAIKAMCGPPAAVSQNICSGSIRRRSFR